MNHFKFITGIAAICACAAASSLSAATIPAGTTLNVKTTSQISERDPKGRTFTGQHDQDIVVNGTTVLKAGMGVTGKLRRLVQAQGQGEDPLHLVLHLRRSR